MRSTFIRSAIVLVAVTLGGAVLLADVRTEQKTHATFGGPLGRMIGMFGGKAAKEGIVETVAVKGDRKMTTSEKTARLIDLAEEKVYEIDLDGKSYKVTTFAEIRKKMQEDQEKAKEQMSKMQEKKDEKPSEPQKKMAIDVSTKETMLAGGAIVVIVLVLSCAYLAWPMLSRSSADQEAIPEVQVEAAVSTKRPAGRRAETRTRAAAGTLAPQPDPAPPGEAADSSGSAITPRRDPDLEIIGPQPVASSLQDSVEAGGSTSEPADTALPASGTALLVQDGPTEPVDLEDRVYSSADAAVVPATLARQQMLPPPIGVVQGVEPLRIELVVSAEGTVERARFLVPPRRMPDMMLLSNAKTWTFNPALKDGRPVRSRLVLSWFVAP